MNKIRKYRPALQSMGWGKWLSVLLIGFSLSIIYPYSQRAGGSHVLNGEIKTGAVADCPYKIGVVRSQEDIFISAKFSPICARLVSSLHIKLVDPAFKIIAESVLHGSPNALKARLVFDTDVPAEDLRLQLEVMDANGDINTASWTLPETLT